MALAGTPLYATVPTSRFVARMLLSIELRSTCHLRPLDVDESPVGPIVREWHGWTTKALAEAAREAETSRTLMNTKFFGPRLVTVRFHLPAGNYLDHWGAGATALPTVAQAAPGAARSEVDAMHHWWAETAAQYSAVLLSAGTDPRDFHAVLLLTGVTRLPAEEV